MVGLRGSGFGISSTPSTGGQQRFQMVSKFRYPSDFDSVSHARSPSIEIWNVIEVH